MAKNGKGFKSLDAGKMKVSGGNGKMAGFKGVGDQKPGLSSVEMKASKGKFPMGGKGKMAGFTAVKAAKKA
jgi:hypothetical protein